MKKLLLLFIPLVVLFGCENDDDNSILTYSCVNDDCFAEEGGQYATLQDCLFVCNNNGDNGDNGDNSDLWSWEVVINNVNHSSSGNCSNYQTTMNYASIGNGNLIINMNINDLTSDTYVSGDYINIQIQIDNPYIGNNEGTLYLSGVNAENSFGGVYFWGGDSKGSDIVFELNSLGTGPNLSNPFSDCGDLENLTGSFSGTIYGAEYSGLPYDAVFPIEINFNLKRQL